MKHVYKMFGFVEICVIAAISSGCNNIKELTKPIETASGDIFSGSCKGAEVIASNDANHVISLKSSYDQTYFYVDGKKVNEEPLKLLKVCLNNERKHKISAQPLPTGCDKIVENLEPPYQNTFYEFQFMLGDCERTSSNNGNNQDNKPSVKRVRSGENSGRD